MPNGISKWHIAYSNLAKTLYNFQKENPENPQEKLLDLVLEQGQDFDVILPEIRTIG